MGVIEGFLVRGLRLDFGFSKIVLFGDWGIRRLEAGRCLVRDGEGC